MITGLSSIAASIVIFLVYVYAVKLDGKYLGQEIFRYSRIYIGAGILAPFICAGIEIFLTTMKVEEKQQAIWNIYVALFGFATIGLSVCAIGFYKHSIVVDADSVSLVRLFRSPLSIPLKEIGSVEVKELYGKTYCLIHDKSNNILLKIENTIGNFNEMIKLIKVRVSS